MSLNVKSLPKNRIRATCSSHISDCTRMKIPQGAYEYRLENRRSASIRWACSWSAASQRVVQAVDQVTLPTVREWKFDNFGSPRFTTAKTRRLWVSSWEWSQWINTVSLLPRHRIATICSSNRSSQISDENENSTISRFTTAQTRLCEWEISRAA